MRTERRFEPIQTNNTKFPLSALEIEPITRAYAQTVYMTTMPTKHATYPEHFALGYPQSCRKRSL